MADFAIKIENVVKEYRLGQIGGGTLRGDLQSWFARLRGKDDPNIPLYQNQYYDITNKKFRALDGVSFTVNKGEAVGIIGRNGAGKSTLLKLISRVTLPTEGTITYKGRVTSMLEVGTGFNGELTGRENIYMNGAILGMTKAEIDGKIDKIIEFSEMEEFIDTPVKRYSSGMYVKLAFAVAAHLDSDILLLDEVLAVGDVKFQDKCLKRMNEASEEENRTVLYVSHNMATIRQFCKRCIVLQEGKVVFDGDVEEAIAVYSESKTAKSSEVNDLTEKKRAYCQNQLLRKVNMTELRLYNTDDCVVRDKSALEVGVKFHSEVDAENIYFKLTLVDNIEAPVATSFTKPFSFAAGDHEIRMKFDISCIKNGVYALSCAMVDKSSFDIFSYLDNIPEAAFIEIPREENEEFLWARRIWSKVELPDAEVMSFE